jgi:hypothetical protein
MEQNFYGRPPVPSAATSSAPTPLRPGTPNTEDGNRNLFDSTDSASNAPGTGTNPFVSPDGSRPASSFESSNGAPYEGTGQRYFHSRLVKKGEIEKPWLEKHDPKEKWVTILPLLGILLGLCISGVLVWDGLSSVVHHKYCPVLDDDFSNGLDPSIWTKEVQVGGFG